MLKTNDKEKLKYTIVELLRCVATAL